MIYTLLIVLSITLFLCIINYLAFRPYRYTMGYRRETHSMHSAINKHVKFKSGKVILNGFVYGEDNTRGVIVFSHGMGVPSDYYIPEAIYFLEKGFKVFLFDNTGYWHNGGVFWGLPQAIKDLRSAIHFIEDGSMPVILFGQSMGAYSACAVLNYPDIRVDEVLAFSGFNDYREMLIEYAWDRLSILSPFAFLPILLFQRIVFFKTMLKTAVDGLNAKNVKAWIIHGSKDRVVKLGKTAIYSKRDKIKNPFVKYILESREGYNSHMGVVRKDKTRTGVNRTLLDSINVQL